MSVIEVNPAEVLGGGTWERLDDGRVLIGAGSSHPAGETGGSENHSITVNEMPSHNHSGSLSGSMGSAGSHNHGRGTMNITGSMHRNDINFEIFPGLSSEMEQSGALSVISKSFNKSQNSATGSNASRPVGIKFDASDGWTGETESTGTHSHSLSDVSVSVGNKGGGSAMSLMQPYLSVYMWKRTA